MIGGRLGVAVKTDHDFVSVVTSNPAKHSEPRRDTLVLVEVKSSVESKWPNPRPQNLSNKYGHRVHFWNLRERKNVQTIDLGANHQMVLEVRPAHDPVKEYGFLGVVVDSTNLEGSIWTWWREDGTFHCKKTATISPEPAKKDDLPPLLQGFEAVPPLVTDIDLSLDDRFLYVSCWGTGEMRQYDVSDPMNPSSPGLSTSAA